MKAPAANHGEEDLKSKLDDRLFQQASDVILFNKPGLVKAKSPIVSLSQRLPVSCIKVNYVTVSGRTFKDLQQSQILNIAVVLQKNIQHSSSK